MTRVSAQIGEIIVVQLTHCQPAYLQLKRPLHFDELLLLREEAFAASASTNGPQATYEQAQQVLCDLLQGRNYGVVQTDPIHFLI